MSLRLFLLVSVLTWLLPACTTTPSANEDDTSLAPGRADPVGTQEAYLIRERIKALTGVQGAEPPGRRRH